MVFRGDANRQVAKSLLTLFDQVEAAFPERRNKANDGTIGNEAHQATNSDHNATSGDGVITALDIAHDPAHGFDAGTLAETLRLNRDPRIKYVIFNGRIFSSTNSPWIWRERGRGPGDHTEHVHISVGRGPDGHTTNPELYDDPAPWAIMALPGTIPTPSAPTVAGRFTNIKATVFNDVQLAYGPKPADFMGYSLPGRIAGELPLRITNRATGLSAIGNKCDIGPWYAAGVRGGEDRWWENGTRPRAETDSQTNGAGIDLYPALARAIGVQIVERNGRIVAGEAQVDVEIISETPPMAESNTDALLRTLITQQGALIEQIAALARVINVVREPGEPPVVVKPQDTPKTPTDPVVTAPSPGPVAATVQSTSMQLSTIAGVAVWALQAFGVLPPGIGEAASQLGAVLTAAPVGSAAISATGGWGLIQNLFNRITGRKTQ
jgi:hypothetical protein